LDKNYLKLNIVEILFIGYGSMKNELTLSFIKLFSVYLANISGIPQKKILQEAFNSKNNLNSEIMSIVDEIIELVLKKVSRKVSKLAKSAILLTSIKKV
jgi:hypothetical protein